MDLFTLMVFFCLFYSHLLGADGCSVGSKKKLDFTAQEKNTVSFRVIFEIK